MQVTRVAVPIAISCLGMAMSGCSSEPSLPPISHALHVSIRESLLDSSTGVLQLQNRSSRVITIGIYIRNEDYNQDRGQRLVLKPQEKLELGRLEINWVFVPNETIMIVGEGYKAVEYRTFRTQEGNVGIKVSYVER